MKTSCTIASVARLAYTVEFVEVNIKGDYAINFDSKESRSIAV